MLNRAVEHMGAPEKKSTAGLNDCGAVSLTRADPHRSSYCTRRQVTSPISEPPVVVVLTV